MRRALAGGAGGGGTGGGGGEPRRAPCRAVWRQPQGGGKGPADAARWQGDKKRKLPEDVQGVRQRLLLLLSLLSYLSLI